MENKALTTFTGDEKAVATLYGGFHRGMTAVNQAKTMKDLVTIVTKEMIEAEKQGQTVLCKYAIIGLALQKAKEAFKVQNGKKPSKEEYATICDTLFEGLAVSTAYQYEKTADIVYLLSKKGKVIEGELIRKLAKESAKTLLAIEDRLGEDIITVSDFLAWKELTKGTVNHEAVAEAEAEAEAEVEAEKTAVKNGTVMSFEEAVAFMREQQILSVSIVAHDKRVVRLEISDWAK